MRVSLASIILYLSIFAIFLLVTIPARAQFATPKDSLRYSRLPAGHTPKRVLTRALLVPGWGQIYNRQYVKASIYYAGLGASTFLISNSNKNYLLYRHAALYAQYRDIDTELRPDSYRDHFVDDYNEILESRGGATENELSQEDQITQRASLAPTLRRIRDQYRRRRDLNILLTFAIWGLGVIESYVSAHLLHFDVSEDLTFNVLPSTYGAHASVTLTF